MGFSLGRVGVATGSAAAALLIIGAGATSAAAGVSVSPLDLGQGIATYDVYAEDPLLGAVETPYPAPQSYVPGGPPGVFDVLENPPGSLTFADVNVVDQPFSLNASAKTVPAPGTGDFTTVFASGGVNFGFAVDGPVAGQIVPVTIQALLRANGATDPTTGFNTALGEGGILATATLSLFDSATYGAGATGYYSFTTGASLGAVDMPIDATVNLTEGDIYYVGESVLLQGGVYPGGSTISASAMADPVFSLPASFAAANPGVSLQISSGLQSLISAPAPVPEPSAWAMMILGLGLGGAALRGRPRVRAA